MGEIRQIMFALTKTQFAMSNGICSYENGIRNVKWDLLLRKRNSQCQMGFALTKMEFVMSNKICSYENAIRNGKRDLLLRKHNS
jgi:hypothetical protein